MDTIPMVYPWGMDGLWIVYEECMEVGNAYYQGPLKANVADRVE